MNRERAKELLPFITAFANGEKVLWKFCNESDQNFRQCVNPAWDDSRTIYKLVKTEKVFIYRHPTGAFSISAAPSVDDLYKRNSWALIKEVEVEY